MIKFLRNEEEKSFTYLSLNFNLRKLSKATTVFSLVFIMMLFSFTVSASHFRYGSVTATRLSETASTVTYRLNVALAWQTSPATAISFAISGGNSGSVIINMTNTNDPGGWINGTGTGNVTLNKSSTLTRLAYTGGAKISNLSNNANGSWNIYTVINTGAPGSSPVSTLPAIINMPINAAVAAYTIPASDPDPGSTLIYGFASISGLTQPAGLTINPTTGQLTWDTRGKLLNQLYNALVTVKDNHGNEIMLDFIIKLVGESNPPQFDYSVTPTNGTIFTALAGQNISFPIQATDSDFASTVGLSVSGLPSYISGSNFSPSLPATGNPAFTTFSWTPTAAQTGNTVVLNFIATDNVGVQSSTSVTIRVAAEPAPVFIYPTPTEGSIKQIIPGVPHSETITAQSSLGSNVSIAFANGIPSNATFSQTIPTIGANPGTTNLNWTPTASDFGPRNLSFQATISSNPTIFSTRNFSYVVNTPPVFATAEPNQTIVAGTAYNYDVILIDQDIPYGDIVNIAGVGLPSWLTLTSIGNGKARLSGTPTAADAGEYHFHLHAEDTYHHGNPEEVEQHAHLTVTACNTELTNFTLNTSCPSSSDGAIDLTVTGGKAPFVFSWSNGATTEDISELTSGNYTVTVTDANNCTVTSTITILAGMDNTAPIAPVLADIIGQCDVTITSVPTAVDNCAGVINGTTSDALSYTAQGNYVITWSFNDGNGNISTSTQNVVIKDNIAPVAPVLADIIGQCDATITSVPTAVDNCAGVINGTTSDALSYTAQGNYVITWSFNDGNGNISTSTQNVVIKDNIAPVVVVQNQTIQLNGSGIATITAADINNGSNDNCGIATVTLNKTSFDCSNYGANTVSLTVTDIHGNISTANAIVNVEDHLAPIVITQNLSVALVNGLASITSAQINNGSTDNCGIASMTIDKTQFDCSSIGNQTITLTVTDIHGNVASKTATVTIVGEITATNIISVPTTSTFTGGVSTNIYLGYGAQSTTLQTSNIVVGGNGTNPKSYTYLWSGSAISQLSSTTSASPIFTPTTAGYYSFNVIVTNKYGCTTAATISICVKDIREISTDKKGNKSFTGKVFICHAPSGNTGNSNTLSISVNAVSSHLSQHGFDRLGSCEDAPCGIAPTGTLATQATSKQITIAVKKPTFELSNTEFVAFPNPFGKQTTVRFTLPYQEENTVLDIYDSKGTKLQSLFKGNANAYTTYEVLFNGQTFAAGTYIFRLITSKEVKTFKVIMTN